MLHESSLKSSEDDLYVELSGDKRTLTVYDSDPDNDTASEKVFEVVIKGYDPSTGSPDYDFTLYQPLDHISDICSDDNPDSMNLTFEVTLYDINEDKADRTTTDFIVTVIGD